MDQTTVSVITPILTQLILALVASALAALTAWLAKRARWADKATKERDLSLAESIARTAVNAAQQIASNTPGWNNQTKYASARTFVKHGLQQAGIDMTDTQVEGLIEGTLHELKLAWDATKAGGPNIVAEANVDVTAAP